MQHRVWERSADGLSLLSLGGRAGEPGGRAGDYLLVIVDSTGVPSPAHFVRIAVPPAEVSR